MAQTLQKCQSRRGAHTHCGLHGHAHGVYQTPTPTLIDSMPLNQWHKPYKNTQAMHTPSMVTKPQLQIELDWGIDGLEIADMV